MTTLDMLNPDDCWQAVERRDKASDGAFVYAVATTGIYCRPSCASRQPHRENVAFFAVPAAAEQQGYRPCKRCRPQNTAISDPRAQVVQAVAEHLSAHVDDSCESALTRLGTRFGYDPQHVQRIFKEVLGLTPKQYTDALRVEQFKNGLRSGETVLEAGINAGYGSVSRTYENGGRALGMSPATYKKGGEGVEVKYATLPSVLGVVMVAATEKGVSAVGLYESEAEAEAAVRKEFPRAQVDNDNMLCDTVEKILAHIQTGTAIDDIALDVQATAFQWRVWRALQAIPRGETRSYTQVAEAIGEPLAVRAVASACSANPVAIVIPCHRVIKNDGAISGYRWGAARKQEILAAERE